MASPGLARRAYLVPVTTIQDATGTIGVAEIADLAGFAAKRFYFLYGVKGRRGGHAHKQLHQLLIALTGTVEIKVEAGPESATFVLSSPREALVIKPMVWRDITMSQGAVLGVLASESFDEEDYIRDHAAFRALSAPSETGGKVPWTTER
jgi:hypothetical protein